jgi:hypothetical protein
MSEHEPLLEPFDQATLAAIKTPFRISYLAGTSLGAAPFRGL